MIKRRTKQNRNKKTVGDGPILCYNERMKKYLKQSLSLLLTLLMLASLAACAIAPDPVPESDVVDFPVYTLEPTDPATAEPVPDTPVDTNAPTDLPTDEPTLAPTDTPCPVSEDGQYDSKDEVALYIHLFGHLPSNYITKSQAQALGWEGGSLEPYAPGCSIGGSRFGNYEGLLPKAKGRTYTECDIDTCGAKSRGAKRIVFSNDGLIYYTDDHYATFTLLYGED